MDEEIILAFIRWNYTCVNGHSLLKIVIIWLANLWAGQIGPFFSWDLAAFVPTVIKLYSKSLVIITVSEWVVS